MDKTNITIAIAVVALIVGIFASFSGSTVVEKVIGASAGPEHTERQSFKSGSSDGGRVATTSAVATYTTNATDFNGTPTYIDWTPNLNTTVSLSSTSTFAYVPNVGDVATVYLRNSSSTAGATITLAAANANLDLQFTEATGGDLVLNGLDYGTLTIVRESEYLVSVLFNEFTEAD